MSVVLLQDVGFPFSHSYSSQREWQRWREEGKARGGGGEEVVERENVGITFGRRIIFMLCLLAQRVTLGTVP